MISLEHYTPLHSEEFFLQTPPSEIEMELK